jgi:hypothetical protein
MRHDFQALQQCLLADHQPATPSEALLVQKMVLSYWRLELLRLCQDRPLASCQLSQMLERSVAHSQRNYFKLLKSLKELQRRRLAGFVLQKRAQAA